MYKRYKDYIYNFSTSIVYLSAQVSILLYFSKFIGIKEAGWFSMAIAITAPVYMLANFQLKWLVATEKEIQPENLINYYIFRFISSGIALIFLISYSFFFINEEKFRTLFLMVVFLKYFESLSDLNYGYLQLVEKFNSIFLLITKRTLFSIIILCLDLFYFKNYQKTFLFLDSLYFSIFVYELIFYIKLSFDFTDIINRIKYIFTSNWQFSIVSFFYSLRVNLPRFILGKVNILQLGVFSTLNYMNYGSNFIFGSLSEVTNVKIKNETNLKKVNRVVINFSFFSILYSLIVFVVFMNFKSLILRIVFKKEIVIENATIILIILNGLVLNLILVIDNMFMIFRFKNEMIKLVFLESITLAFIYFLTKPENLNVILFIQIIIVIIFFIISLYIFKSRFIKDVSSNSSNNDSQ